MCERAMDSVTTWHEGDEANEVLASSCCYPTALSVVLRRLCVAKMVCCIGPKRLAPSSGRPP